MKMEQGGGLLDNRRPGDVEVADWVVVSNWKNNTSLSIDVAIIDPTGESHCSMLRRYGVGAAATKYQMRKRKTYEDIEGMFSPFVIEAQGGFGIEAKRLVRELEKRRKERECIPNTRVLESFQPLGEVSLVTAIGFELARRNARMILDRAPEDQALIPPERTKIRLEMELKKANADRLFKTQWNKNSTNEEESISKEVTGVEANRTVAGSGMGVVIKQKGPEHGRNLRIPGNENENYRNLISAPSDDGKGIRDWNSGEKVKGSENLLPQSKSVLEKELLYVDAETGATRERAEMRTTHEARETIVRDDRPTELQSRTWDCTEAQQGKFDTRFSEGDATTLLKSLSAPHLSKAKSIGDPAGDNNCQSRVCFARDKDKHYQDESLEDKQPASVRRQGIEEPEEVSETLNSEGIKKLRISVGNSELGQTTRLSPRQAPKRLGLGQPGPVAKPVSADSAPLPVSQT